MLHLSIGDFATLWKGDLFTKTPRCDLGSHVPPRPKIGGTRGLKFIVKIQSDTELVNSF